MSKNDQIVRTAYLAMELIGWCVIVPFSIASLLTGLVQSLGTSWGLFRHYWIVAKLFDNGFCQRSLLVHMQVANRMASVVAGTTIGAGDFHGMRIQLVGDAVAAIVVLLVATALSVFKPQGLTPSDGIKAPARMSSTRLAHRVGCGCLESPSPWF